MSVRKGAGLLAGMVLGLSTAAMAEEPKEAPGKELFVQRCQACHELETITVQRHTNAEWRDIVDRMVLYGAEVTGDDTQTIIAYLSTAYGTDTAAAPAPASHSRRAVTARTKLAAKTPRASAHPALTAFLVDGRSPVRMK